MKYRPLFPMVVLLGLSLACGDEKIVNPSDRTPPSAVQDLTATSAGTTSIDLSWTAPGDDGSTGTAASFDLRMATSPEMASAFVPATILPSPPQPLPAGSTQTYHLSGLEEGTAYYFALKASDEVPNVSGISNVATATTAAGPDTIPPAAITDLAVVSVTSSSVTLRWTAPGDDDISGQASAYDLRFSSNPIDDASWNAATRVDNLPLPGHQGTLEEHLVEGFERDETVHFAIRALDERANESRLSNVLTAKTAPMPRTWFIQADGSGDAPTIQAGIDASHPGDTVLVGPGTYFESIDFKGKDIVVKGQMGRDATVIDGSRDVKSVVQFQGPETRAAVIEGFTITGGSGVNGQAGNPLGGGIFTREASPTIRSNNIVRNSVRNFFGLGGGICIGSYADKANLASPLIEDNVIEGNEAFGNGGGMAIRSSRSVLRRNTFQNNRCPYDGGGVWALLGWGRVVIENCLFVENTVSDHGGGLYITQQASTEDCVVTLSTFIRNEALGEGFGDTGSGGGIALYDVQGTFSRNTIVGNRGIGETKCSGGGILLNGESARPGIMPIVDGNVITGNEGCGIACRKGGQAMTGRNLFWANDIDVGMMPEACDSAWISMSLFEDPQFCDPENDDYRVSAQSPALQGEEVIGAFDVPGCSSAMTLSRGWTVRPGIP